MAWPTLFPTFWDPYPKTPCRCAAGASAINESWKRQKLAPSGSMCLEKVSCPHLVLFVCLGCLAKLSMSRAFCFLRVKNCPPFWERTWPWLVKYDTENLPWLRWWRTCWAATNSRGPRNSYESSCEPIRARGDIDGGCWRKTKWQPGWSRNHTRVLPIPWVAKPQHHYLHPQICLDMCEGQQMVHGFLASHHSWNSLKQPL